MGDDGGCRGDEDVHLADSDDPVVTRLRDRFRVSVIKIAESEAKKYGMEVSSPVASCIADLAFKFTEQLAMDLELFMQHAGRKSINVEDVILSSHRNKHVTTMLRSYSNELKEREPQLEKKRKKAAREDDKIIVE